MAPLLQHRNRGAQVLQACGDGASSIFYLSPLSAAAMAVAPARGGVPVLFPQFADRGLLPKHGLVRTANWELLDEQVLQGSHSLRYLLDIEPDDYPAWPHAARLILTVATSPAGLTFKLHVTNTGNRPFTWTGGLHPYFAVQDVLQSRLSGLAGLSVQDRYDPAMLSQPQGDLQWSLQPFERLYDACPPLRLDTGNCSLRLCATGFDQWMIWNPGQVDGGALADLPKGDWQRFICVEPVCVDRPVVLAPGANFVGSLSIAICK